VTSGFLLFHGVRTNFVYLSGYDHGALNHFKSVKNITKVQKHT